MIKLHSAGDLAAAEATGADINMLRCSVHDGLDALHIRLPRTVRASVRMADFDAEGHALIAELTLCHIVEAPPCLCFSVPAEQLLYNSRPFCRLQEKVLHGTDFLFCGLRKPPTHKKHCQKQLK